MPFWRWFRYQNSNGSCKYWAITTNIDGSVSTRWGKNAHRLTGFASRNGIRQADIERQKQNKGYVFIGEVLIDDNGHITSSTLNATVTTQPSSTIKERLYWSIDCQAKLDICADLGKEIQRLIAEVKYDDEDDDDETEAQQHPAKSVPVKNWEGWQTFTTLSLKPQPFALSGQLQAEHGVMPCLFLMALKAKAFAQVEVGIATEQCRELSTDLKAEAKVLAWFGTHFEAIRAIAERMGLVKPKLNLGLVMSEPDQWF